MLTKIVLEIPGVLDEQDAKNLPAHLRAYAADLVRTLRRGGTVKVEQVPLSDLLALAYLACAASRQGPLTPVDLEEADLREVMKKRGAPGPGPLSRSVAEHARQLDEAELGPDCWAWVI